MALLNVFVINDDTSFQLLELEENYRVAIDGYQRAVCLDPFFKEAKDRLTHLMAYLTRCDKSVRGKVSRHVKSKFIRKNPVMTK